MNGVVRAALLSGLGALLAVTAASAQGRPPPRLTDQQLVVQLHELTRAKGDYNKRGLNPEFCRRLGVRPIGNCEVFQAVFTRDGKPAVAVYSLDDGRNGMVRVFITSHLNPDFVEDYNVDLEGKLERVVRRRGNTSSRAAVRDAGANFARTMDFLRARLDEFASWPDATVADDGSCPPGQIKRVPRNPRNAVCVDRKRLKMR
jgi:hypothetical protein